MLTIYKVIGWTNPIDWASPTKACTLGYFQSRFGAEDKIADMKSEPDYGYDWSEFEIEEIGVWP